MRAVTAIFLRLPYTALRFRSTPTPHDGIDTYCKQAGRSALGSLVERELTAILCADVYGYSRLLGEDEEATLRILSYHHETLDGLIEQHRGRFVNVGDRGSWFRIVN